MKFLELDKTDILSLDEFLAAKEEDTNSHLVKALFKHAYYSHLVPQQITGKDGVKRIYWVNPGKDIKKPKLNVVAQFHEGTRDEHHKQILADNNIDLDKVHAISHGDKVRVTNGRHKGQIGIFAGAHITDGNKSPRGSVKFEDKDGKWKTGNPVGINSMELVHRANDKTRAAIAPKTVTHTTQKGTTTIISKTWKPKTDAGAAPTETFEERHKRLGLEIRKGILFQRTDGAKVYIADERNDEILVQMVNSKVGRKRGWVDKKRFTELVEKGIYRRAGKTIIEPDDKDKKLTRKLETGALHITDKVTYDDHGRPQLDPDIAKGIIFENWSYIERVIATETSKFPTVDPAEIGGVDFYGKMVNAVNTFEPYLNSNLQSRLYQYVSDATHKKASQVYQLNLLRSRAADDAALDPTDSFAAKADPADDGDTNILSVGGGFINRLDALIFHDMVNEEAEKVKWLIGNDEYVDTMMGVTGIGTAGKGDGTNREAAKELYGKLLNSDGKPISVNAIESHLSRTYTKMINAFKDEIKRDPSFGHFIRSTIEYRAKLQRKKMIVEPFQRDYKVIKEMTKTYDTGRNARAKIAGMLIKHGAPVADAPKLIEMVERIIEGRLVPYNYKTALGTEKNAQIVQDTLTEMIPKDTLKIVNKKDRPRLLERFKVVEWFNHNPDKGKTMLPAPAWLIKPDNKD